jgi:hypothetical protein
MKPFFKSLSFFSSLIIFKKDVDVVISYPTTFNRGSNKENILIKPLVNALKAEGLNYIVFEEGDLSRSFGGYQFTDHSVPLTFVTSIEMIVRKILQIILITASIETREKVLTKILAALFFRNFSTQIVITLISHKVALWRTCFPGSHIYDYQHGIIFDGDWGYLLDGKPPKFKTENKIKTLTHGKSVSNMLIKNDKTDFYNSSTTFDIGLQKLEYKRPTLNQSNKPIKKILFSLQDAADGSLEDLSFYLAKVECFLSEIADHLIENNLIITFRHHPRSNMKFQTNFIDKYSFAVPALKNTDLESMLADHDLHLTFNSSSAIEAAYIGVPTIFLELENPSDGDFPNLSAKYTHFKQLNYPLKNFIAHNGAEFVDLLIKIKSEGLQESSKIVNEWINLLYSDFNSERFIKILKKDLKI